MFDQFNTAPGRTSSPNPEPSASEPFTSNDPFKARDPFSNPAPSTQPKGDPFGSAEKSKGSLVGGLILITLGSLFLINQLIPNVDFGDLWPVLLVVIGAGLLINSIIGRK